jgi:hypothetical protein
VDSQLNAPAGFPESARGAVVTLQDQRTLFPDVTPCSSAPQAQDRRVTLLAAYHTELPHASMSRCEPEATPLFVPISLSPQSAG